jgi:hypothetical protein
MEYGAGWLKGGLQAVTEGKCTATARNPDMNLVKIYFSDYLSAGDLSTNYPLIYQYNKWVCHTTGWHNIQAPTHLHYKILHNSLKFFLILETNLE